MTALEIFNGSNADQTKDYYKRLDQIGPIGKVATALLRASKCSTRAKQYRKRAWRTDAYDRKQWSLSELCKLLVFYGSELKINYGWKQDPKVLFGNGYGYDADPSWVLYVDLPTGQVSFHNRTRGQGPSYNGEWDGQKNICHERVIAFCDSILK